MYISIENETQNVTIQYQDKKLKKLVQFYISKSNNKHGLYITQHIYVCIINIEINYINIYYDNIGLQTVNTCILITIKTMTKGDNLLLHHNITDVHHDQGR